MADDPLRKCADCPEHSGVMTLLNIHSEFFKLFEKRFSQVFIGLFLCIVTGIASILVAAQTPPQSVASAAEIKPAISDAIYQGANMDIIEIHRKESTSTETVGVILVNKKMVGFTLERPKKGNERRISCIPVGQYMAKKYFSKKYKRECLMLFDVYGREYIAIHNGNTCDDTLGCILVGKGVGYTDDKRMVQYSKAGLKTIVDLVGKESLVTIIEDF